MFHLKPVATLLRKMVYVTVTLANCGDCFYTGILIVRYRFSDDQLLWLFDVIVLIVFIRLF